MWYLSHSILARASDLKLSVRGERRSVLPQESSLCPVYSSGRLSQDALGSTPGLPVCMLSLFLSVVFALVFYIWGFGGTCHNQVRKQGSFAATNSRRVKFRSLHTEDSRHCVRHQCNMSGYCGDIVYRSFPPSRSYLRFVYGPPAEGGFLYLTHSRWESLKEGRMKFLSPAFVFIHSEEVFIFAQSLHPVYPHSKQKTHQEQNKT